MDWAQDYRGNIIQARRGAYLGYHLTCPTCGEPVYLRAGRTRRPHFAHYSNRARPDCEYYHPSTDAFPRLSPPPSFSSALHPKRDSLRCGLFLALRPDPVGFDLFLRIPSLEHDDALNGGLVIEHGRGTKSYSPKQLTRAQIIPLSPKVPLLECNGTGSLSSLSTHIGSQTNQFSRTMNFFSSADNGGRLLFPQEQLEWGASYWVLSEEAVPLPDNVSAHIGWRRRGSLATWPVYEITLPGTHIALRHDAESILSAFFGRSIRARQPRAYVVHPAPHHLAPDGALIYPSDPEELFVRRTSNQAITIEGPSEIADNAVITILTEDWVRLTGIKLGSYDLAILINGVEQVILRSEECPLIQPSGVRLCSEELSWDALAETPFTSEELFVKAIRVECGNDRLASYLAKINQHWTLEKGSTLTLPQYTEKMLNARGFGAIRPQVRECDSNDSDELVATSPPFPLHAASWIEGLVRTRYGRVLATHASNYITNPNDLNLKKLGSLLTSPLMAYINAAICQRVK